MPEEKKGHKDSYWIRIKDVSTYILNNPEFLESKRTKDLLKEVKELWNLEDRQAWQLISDAKKDIKQLYSKNVDKKIKKALREREEDIRRIKFELDDAKKPAEKARFIQLLQAARKDRDELSGLYEQTVKHTGTVSLKNINLSSLTDDQLAKLKAFLSEGVELKEALLHLGVIIK